MAAFGLFVVGCGSPEVSRVGAALGQGVYPNVVEDEGWTVTAHNPVLLADGRVQGSFTLERISGADTHRGGACLLADLKGRRVRCDNQDECLEALGPAPSPGGFHYCAGVSGSDDKTCWTRPVFNCIRGVDFPGGALGPGTYSLPPTVALDVDGKPITKWMTYAILIKSDGVHLPSTSQVLDLADE